MNKKLTFFNTSIGKKIVIALSGLFLILFLIVHLLGNLLLFKNDNGHAFNNYASILDDPGNIPVRIAELFLVILFFIHIYFAIRISISNYKARTFKYKIYEPNVSSSFYSRFMFQSGLVVLLFLILHVFTFSVQPRFISKSENIYLIVTNTFNNPIFSGFYIAAITFLFFHLAHSVQSFFQTIGFYHKRYTPIIKISSFLFSLTISLGFLFMPIYFLLKKYTGF